MAEWDPNDFRIFCGDLGNEVSDELLAKAFRKYPSFQKAKVVRDSRTNKSKGFGFVSFKHQDVRLSNYELIDQFVALGFYPCNERNGRQICRKSADKITKEQLEGTKFGHCEEEEQGEEEAWPALRIRPQNLRSNPFNDILCHPFLLIL